MGKNTFIQYSDHSWNDEMGCDGCELWLLLEEDPVESCYAGTMTRIYQGKHKGYPNNFNVPQLFPHRFGKPATWKDLTGTERKDKPWLNGLPAIIFMNDMGDAWSESLPVDWMIEPMKVYENSPHIYLWLTKRPARMLETFRILGYVPKNFRLGTSVTKRANISRAKKLLTIGEEFPDARLWISAEPVWQELTNLPLQQGNAHIHTLITGGESGTGAQPTPTAVYRHLRDLAIANGTDFFFKQHGKYRHEDQGIQDVNPKNGIFWEGDLYHNFGNKYSGRMLDGVYHNDLGWARDS